MKVIVTAVMIAAGVLFWRQGYSEQDRPQSIMENKCELHLTLGQSIADISDFRWAKLDDGEYQTYKLFTQEEKCEIAIRLPSGKSVVYKPLNIDLAQSNHALNIVYLRLNPQSLNYTDVLKNLVS